MHATIDKAGRLVLPKALRDQVGLRAGEVNVFADGAGLRIEPIAGEALEEREDRLVVAPSGLDVNDEMVRALRDADQR
jgi:AbrB family looped-hinge helix DNA binding protein